MPTSVTRLWRADEGDEVPAEVQRLTVNGEPVALLFHVACYYLHVNGETHVWPVISMAGVWGADTSRASVLGHVFRLADPTVTLNGASLHFNGGPTVFYDSVNRAERRLRDVLFPGAASGPDGYALSLTD